MMPTILRVQGHSWGIRFKWYPHCPVSAAVVSHPFSLSPRTSPKNAARSVFNPRTKGCSGKVDPFFLLHVFLPRGVLKLGLYPDMANGRSQGGEGAVPADHYLGTVKLRAFSSPCSEWWLHTQVRCLELLHADGPSEVILHSYYTTWYQNPKGYKVSLSIFLAWDMWKSNL